MGPVRSHNRLVNHGMAMINVGQTTLKHGGDLHRAIELYGGTAEQWLDLSTGVSPWAYPVSSIDPSVWRTLPTPPTQLVSIAAEYYQCDQNHIVPVPGSQLAIRLLPTLLKQLGDVACPLLGYQEHAAAWEFAGHRIIRYRSMDELATLIDSKTISHAVVISPNNPTTETTAQGALIDIAKRLPGLLIVDEAFADADNSRSLCSNLPANAVVLRSLGKFFGLAGARVGFCISRHSIAVQIARFFNPWSINAAAQQIATNALADTDWQLLQRERILSQSAQLESMICNLLLSKLPDLTVARHALFITLFGKATTVAWLHNEFARRLIWTRLGDTNDQPENWLRLSLPGEQSASIKDVLTQLNTTLKNDSTLVRHALP